jgi:hypothetical protein
MAKRSEYRPRRESPDFFDDARSGKTSWPMAIAGVLLGHPSVSEEEDEAKRRDNLNSGPLRGDAFQTRPPER